MKLDYSLIKRMSAPGCKSSYAYEEKDSGVTKDIQGSAFDSGDEFPEVSRSEQPLANEASIITHSTAELQISPLDSEVVQSKENHKGEKDSGVTGDLKSSVFGSLVEEELEHDSQPPQGRV